MDKKLAHIVIIFVEIYVCSFYYFIEEQNEKYEEESEDQVPVV